LSQAIDLSFGPLWKGKSESFPIFSASPVQQLDSFFWFTKILVISPLYFD